MAEYGHAAWPSTPTGTFTSAAATSSLAFPTTAGSLQATSPANASTDGYAGFVTKLKPDGSAILWSTYLGGDDRPVLYLSGLAVDAAGALWVLDDELGRQQLPDHQRRGAGHARRRHLRRPPSASSTPPTGAWLWDFPNGNNDDGPLAGFTWDESVGHHLDRRHDGVRRTSR